MGRALHLIWWAVTLPIRLILALMSFSAIGLLVVCGWLGGLFGGEVKTKRPEDERPLVQDAREKDPEGDTDDKQRAWMDDLNPEAKLRLVDHWFNEQAAEVGPVVGDPFEKWAARKRAQREAAQMN